MGVRKPNTWALPFPRNTGTIAVENIAAVKISIDVRCTKTKFVSLHRYRSCFSARAQCSWIWWLQVFWEVSMNLVKPLAAGISNDSWARQGKFPNILWISSGSLSNGNGVIFSKTDSHSRRATRTSLTPWQYRFLLFNSFLSSGYFIACHSVILEVAVDFVDIFPSF